MSYLQIEEKKEEEKKKTLSYQNNSQQNHTLTHPRSQWKANNEMHLRSGTTFQWRIATQIARLHTEPRAKRNTRNGDARSILLFTIGKVSIATTSPLFRLRFLFSSFSCATISTSIGVSLFSHAKISTSTGVSSSILVVRQSALPLAFLH